MVYLIEGEGIPIDQEEIQKDDTQPQPTKDQNWLIRFLKPTLREIIMEAEEVAKKAVGLQISIGEHTYVVGALDKREGPYNVKSTYLTLEALPEYETFGELRTAILQSFKHTGTKVRIMGDEIKGYHVQENTFTQRLRVGNIICPKMTLASKLTIEKTHRLPHEDPNYTPW